MVKKKPVKKCKTNTFHDIYIPFMVGKNEWHLLTVAYGLVGVYGYCDLAKRLIVVDGTLSEQKFLETVLHEASHAICPKESEKLVRFRGNTLGALMMALQGKSVEKPA